MSAVTTATLPATVRDIMTRNVVSLSPDDTLRDAIGVLDAEAISGAPVVARGAVVGVLSTTDVLSFEAVTPGVPTEDDTRVQEPAIGAEEPAKDETHPVSSYFTDIWDNAGSDVLERVRTTTSPEWDVLSEHVVSCAPSRPTQAWRTQPATCCVSGFTAHSSWMAIAWSASSRRATSCA